MPANKKILADEQGELRSSVLLLNPAQREIVELAIREVCEHRRYLLHSVNVRTNHAHSVVSALCKPEHIMDSFKSYSTRKLREADLVGADTRPWARHGSTAYLWTEEQVRRAIEYVKYGQGDEPFS